MYRDHEVGVVVTAYNEAAFVGGVLEGIPEYVDRVYVVDDGSTDDTWAAIRRHATTEGVVVPPGERVSERRRVDDRQSRTGRPDGGHPSTDLGDADATGTTATVGSEAGPVVVPIRHARNGGTGAAAKTGYRHALADGVDVVAVVNGDGQMDTGILHRFLDPIVEGRAEFAKGTRLSRPAHRESMTGWRLFGNVLLTGMTRVATGYWGLSDAQNGYTAISRETLSALDLGELYDRHGFLNDMLAHLSALDARIADVPHPAVYGDEDSSIRYGQFVPGLSALLARRFFVRLGRGLRDPLFLPAPFGYAAGSLAVCVGVLQVLALLAGVDVLDTSVSAASATVALGALALVFGLGWDVASGRIRDGARVRVERGDPA